MDTMDVDRTRRSLMVSFSSVLDGDGRGFGLCEKGGTGDGRSSHHP